MKKRERERKREREGERGREKKRERECERDNMYVYLPFCNFGRSFDRTTFNENLFLS